MSHGSIENKATLAEVLKEIAPITPEWMNEVAVSKTLFEHQKEDLIFFSKYDRWGLFSEPGVGKTLPMQAYGLLLTAYKNRVVYVMPPILIPQFRQSLNANFIGIENFVSVGQLNGDFKERSALLEQWKGNYPDIMLISYRMFVIHWDLLRDEGYSMVFVDEATAVKSPSSQIHKAVEGFAKRGNGVGLITGTPIETNVQDCYGLIQLITPKVYSSWKNFEYLHCEKDSFYTTGGKKISKIMYYINLELLNERLFAQGRRVLKQDVSDLPPRLVSEYIVPLSSKHKALYSQMVEERMLEIGEKVIDMTTAQSLYQAMQRVLLNPAAFGTEIKENTLFETLDAIIEQLDGHKILVYAWFNASVETICERYTHLNPAKLNGSVSGKNREDNKQKFIQDPTCRLLVANPKSGGVGVDGLQHVCSHVVYAEVCPFVGTFQQSMDRLHRTGQTSDTVNIYLIVAKDTVAVKLRNDLVRKDNWQEGVVQDKRTVLKQLLGDGGLQGSLD